MALAPRSRAHWAAVLLAHWVWGWQGQQGLLGLQGSPRQLLAHWELVPPARAHSQSHHHTHTPCPRLLLLAAPRM
jgi:hypothetical protein